MRDRSMDPLFSVTQELMLLAPVPVLLVANAADAGAERASPPRWAGVPVTPSLARGVLAVMPVLLALLGFADLVAGALSEPTRQAQRTTVATGVGLLLVAVATALVLVPGTLRLLARMIPIRPGSVTNQAALVMTLAVIGSQLVTQVTTDVLAEATRTGHGLTRVDLVLNELPFLVVAILGVGLWTRRGTGEVVRRLGLGLPRPWMLIAALAAALLFNAFGIGMDALTHRLTPDMARRVDAANANLFGGLGDPLGVLTIAIAAGVCEEVLFRGAIQPRLGLVLASLLFASVHSQYGLSVDVLAVFVLAIGLGLIRVVGGTTAAIVAHVAYDALVGVGVAAALWPWLLVGATGVGALAAAAWALDRRAARLLTP